MQIKKDRYIHTYIQKYKEYPRYLGCVLFKSAALSLVCVRVPWLLRLWETKPLFTILLAPEASKFRIYWMFLNSGSLWSLIPRFL